MQKMLGSELESGKFWPGQYKGGSLLAEYLGSNLGVGIDVLVLLVLLELYKSIDTR